MGRAAALSFVWGQSHVARRLPFPVGVRGRVNKQGAYPQRSDLRRRPLTPNLCDKRVNSDPSIARPSGPAFGGPNGRLRRA